jgi:hypothetical protein
MTAFWIILLFIAIALIANTSYWWIFFLVFLIASVIFIAFCIKYRVTCPFCSCKYISFIQMRCPDCDGIDFKNILFVRVNGSRMTYRKEERYYWRKYYYDGAFHSLAEPYEVTLKNGLNYSFTIVYNDDKPTENRSYHESSPFCEMLLEKAESNPIIESLNEVADALSNLGQPPKE